MSFFSFPESAFVSCFILCLTVPSLLLAKSSQSHCVSPVSEQSFIMLLPRGIKAVGVAFHQRSDHHHQLERPGKHSTPSHRLSHTLSLATPSQSSSHLAFSLDTLAGPRIPTSTTPSARTVIDQEAQAGKMADSAARMDANPYPYKDELRELYADMSIRQGRIFNVVEAPELYGVTPESIRQLIQERAQGKPMRVYLMEFFANLAIFNGQTTYPPEKYGITNEALDEVVARKKEEAGKSEDANEGTDALEEDLIKFPSEEEEHPSDEEELIGLSADTSEQISEVSSPFIPPEIMRNFEIGRSLIPQDIECLERAFEENRRRDQERIRPDLHLDTDVVEPESPCSTSSTPISSPGMRARQEARKAARKAQEDAEREAAEQVELETREAEMQIELRRNERDAAKLEAIRSVKNFFSAAGTDSFVGALRVFSSSLDFTRNHMKSLIFLGLMGVAGYKAIGKLTSFRGVKQKYDELIANTFGSYRNARRWLQEWLSRNNVNDVRLD